MKTLLNFYRNLDDQLRFLLLCMLVAGVSGILMSCSTTDANDNLQGKRIGTWMAYQNKANWVGTQGASPMALMAKTDTTAHSDSVNVTGTFLNTPKGVSITMTTTRPGVKHPRVFISFVDSNVIRRELPENKAWGVEIDNEIFDNHGLGVDFDNKYFNVTNHIPFIPCDSSYNKGNNIIVYEYVNDVDNKGKIINFNLKNKIVLNTTGIEQTVKYLEGC